MKVSIEPSGAITCEAPMAWVMPPASLAATSVLRSASSSEVLPWSTWPITVTTGDRRTRLSSSSSSSSTPHSIPSLSVSAASEPARDTSAPNPSAMASAVSASIDCVADASTPRFIRSLTTSAMPTLSLAARSPTVMDSPSRTRTGPVGSSGAATCPRPLFLGRVVRAVASVSSSNSTPPRFSRRALTTTRALSDSSDALRYNSPFFRSFPPILRRRCASDPPESSSPPEEDGALSSDDADTPA
eukprot:scaffold331_cov101-Isochrysis_galbana.AAC.2